VHPVKPHVELVLPLNLTSTHESPYRNRSIDGKVSSGEVYSFRWIENSYLAGLVLRHLVLGVLLTLLPLAICLSSFRNVDLSHQNSR
jgi:hypothetical protein